MLSGKGVDFPLCLLTERQPPPTVPHPASGRKVCKQSVSELNRQRDLQGQHTSPSGKKSRNPASILRTLPHPHHGPRSELALWTDDP